MAKKQLPKNKIVWKSHVRNLFDEVLINEPLKFMHKPFAITMSILGEAAEYAAELGDEKMIGYFARLAIYNFSDPTNKKEFDRKRTDYYVNKTK